MSIYIGEPIVISDMQGPCPDGFHIPLSSERTAMKTADYYISSGWFPQADFHIPQADYIQSNGTRNTQNYGYYWMADWNTTYSRPNNFSMRDQMISTQYSSMGCSIRPFKNTFVEPESSWTVIRGAFGGNGIFWNQTDEIISIVYNDTKITIADKNLGATEVYINQATKTQANCGKYYQWGNNHGFDRAAPTKTNSSQVNASSYGPGNYYESDTFRSISSSNWDSSNNANLRGGVSQGTSTKSVEVQNIYIGEYRTTSLTADLTTQSLADLQAAGWTGILQNNGYSLDSNGLTPIGNTSALYYYYGDLSTDSVIELEMTGYASRNYSNHDYQYNAYCALGLATSAVGYGTSAYMAITTTGIAGTYNASNPIWMKCGTIYQNTLIGNEVSGNTAGNVNMKFKLDLKNKKVEYTITSPVSATTTGTLTDSQVQTILGYKYIRIEAGKWDATAYSHVYTAKLRIGG